MNKILYSSCNEDANSEIQALRIKPEDTILCITGSGARILDLLTQAPQKIIAIDCNPAQQHLLKLKAAAIKSLTHEQFSQFIGLSPCDDRTTKYYYLRSLLEVETRTFWDKHLAIINNGILFQGQWERYFKLNARVMQYLRSTKQKQLFAFDNLAEQQLFWENEWANGFWRLMLKLFSNRFVWQYFLRDPGFYAYVPKSFNIYQYIKEQFDRASQQFLLNESHFAQLLFWGKWNEDILPPHLQKKHYDILKTHINAIDYCNMDLLTGLKQLPEGAIDKFSLSDFSSYTPLEEYKKIWSLMPIKAKANAIVCERQFLVKRDIEEHSILQRDKALESWLAQTDQSIFYTFVIGEFMTS